MQRGVSLIELMVGLTIMAILLAFGLPGSTAWIQNSQIRTAAESVRKTACNWREPKPCDAIPTFSSP